MKRTVSGGFLRVSGHVLILDHRFSKERRTRSQFGPSSVLESSSRFLDEIDSISTRKPVILGLELLNVSPKKR